MPRHEVVGQSIHNVEGSNFDIGADHNAMGLLQREGFVFGRPGGGGHLLQGPALASVEGAGSFGISSPAIHKANSKLCIDILRNS